MAGYLSKSAWLGYENPSDFLGGISPPFLFTMDEIIFFLKIICLELGCISGFLTGFFIMVALKYRDLL